MAYQAIAHGANGILYWGLHLGPENNPAWQAAKAVAEELRPIAAELAARPLPASLPLVYFETGHSLDRGIAYSLRPTRDGVLLIAVNEDKNPVLVSFGKTCTAPPRVAFAPFEAKVFRCSR
jgi:hypothetical protein